MILFSWVTPMTFWEKFIFDENAYEAKKSLDPIIRRVKSFKFHAGIFHSNWLDKSIYKILDTETLAYINFWSLRWKCDVLLYDRLDRCTLEVSMKNHRMEQFLFSIWLTVWHFFSESLDPLHGDTFRELNEASEEFDA